MLTILAFVVLPSAKAAPINNETSEPMQEQVTTTVTVEVKPDTVEEKATESPTERPQEVKPQVAIKTNVATDKQELMRQAGIPESEWGAVDYIVSHESGWRPTVYNSSGSGAYGLCQALPASKMSTAGDDYMTNPVTQLKWCSSYASSRYGGWWGAHNFWVNNYWW
jgi:hypothetical protein